MIVKNTTGLEVASNEYSTKYSVNRLLKLLLENDELLQQFYNEVFSSFSIYEYEAGEEY